MTVAEVAEGPRRTKVWPRSTWLAIVLCLPLLLPIMALLAVAWTADQSSFQGLSAVLPSLAWQTVALLSGVGLLTLVIGASLAWLVTVYDFPGRRLLQWTAVLPLALPGYIVSFVAVDMLSYSGPLQSALRPMLGWTSPQQSWLPEIRSLGGAIIALALVLYPYVYMTARVAFLRLPQSQIDAARLLGRRRTAAFFEIALPQARAALAVGVSLVLMETLNDIGAVSFFGVNTVTYGIYSLWQGEGNLGAAARLALLLLFCVALLIAFEQVMRRRADMAKSTRMTRSSSRAQLHGWRAVFAVVAGFAPVIFGFVFPVIALLSLAEGHWTSSLTAGFGRAAANSLLLAVLTTALCLLIALAFTYGTWRNTRVDLKRLTQLASLGYGIPGTILAIGVLYSFGTLDRWINGATRALFDWTPGLILSGSMIALTFALVTRLLAIATGSLNTGMEKISPHLGEAARSLGRAPRRTFLDIQLPLLMPAILSGGLLVFVDALKELPATLMLRPFDFETLATHVFALASLGQLEDSAVPSLLIVAIGLVPVALLSASLRDPK